MYRDFCAFFQSTVQIRVHPLLWVLQESGTFTPTFRVQRAVRHCHALEWGSGAVSGCVCAVSLL